MGPRHYLSFCACTTPWLAPELLGSMGSSPHLWFLDAKQRLMDRNNKSLWVPDITCRFVQAKQRDLHQNDKSIWVPALICVFFSCKTASLWPDLQVCMGPRPHLWFLHANQQLLDQNCMSLWVPDTHLPILCMQNTVISTRNTSLYGSQPSSVVFACKTATFGLE